MIRLAVPCLCLFAACSSAPEPRREADPAIEARYDDSEYRDFQAVLLRLDVAMDEYAAALSHKGQMRADMMTERLERLLRETVLDDKPRPGVPVSLLGENYRRLQALAANASLPNQRAIALAALGFSGRPEVMPLIVQGALADDPHTVDRAVFGLAILRSPETPIGLLAAIVENPEHPADGRAQAAWALYQVQTALIDTSPVLALWQRYLTTERDRMSPAVLMTAVRGLGASGDASHAPLVAEYLSYPVPKIREAAAIALGRMNAQGQWQALLERLGPNESVQNVRLAARHALAALAGNTDYGYDVAAWRKVFERGS